MNVPSLASTHIAEVGDDYVLTILTEDKDTHDRQVFVATCAAEDLADIARQINELVEWDDDEDGST